MCREYCYLLDRIVSYCLQMRKLHSVWSIVCKFFSINCVSDIEEDVGSTVDSAYAPGNGSSVGKIDPACVASAPSCS